MTAEMFDSIDPSQIPPNQDDAGYVDGRWQTFSALRGPHNLSVAVFATDDADALDDEPGDATNAQAPGWVQRELGLGHWRPCVYTSVSNVQALLTALAAAGMSRSQVRIWTAHYTYVRHRCTPACCAGLPADFLADATQWTDRSGGRNLDESTIADDFFPSDISQEDLVLIVNTPSEGIWLLSGSLYAHIMAPATVTNFEQAGVKSVVVDEATHQNLVAASEKSAAASPSGSGQISGTLTIS